MINYNKKIVTIKIKYIIKLILGHKITNFVHKVKKHIEKKTILNKYAELNLPILEASLRGITVNFPSDRPAY